MALLAAVVGGPGCSTKVQRSREAVGAGRLEVGLRQEAFLSEWGQPTRTSSRTGADIIKAQWTGGSFSLRSGRHYDVWDYSGRGVRLIFYRRELVTWQSDKTVEELSSRKN